MTTSVGIDLGTTYSCVMHYSSDGTEILVPASSGGDLTPSVVYISAAHEVMIGEDAKWLLQDDPDNVIVGIKRQMGKEYPLEFGGRTLTPEGISALILSRLAMDACETLNVGLNDLQAVITVPAYFGVAERESTAAAARIAGINCPELLPEPVAAAYAYGLSSEPLLTSLVYDLGGGTFDAAVVGLHNGQHRVGSVDGESRLGGLDWDRRIENLLWERIEALEDGDELRFQEEVIATVQSVSERVKRTLSGADETTVRIRAGRNTVQLNLTRQRFDEVTHDLMLRTIASVERCIQSARAAGSPPVDQILLVGGSTRMPMVREMLASRLMLPIKLTDPDKAIARGAAILSEQLLAKKESRAITRNGIKSMASGLSRITSVLPRSLGVLIQSSQTPFIEEPYVAHFIPANTPLPIHRLECAVSTMVPNQNRARILLYEQGGNVASARVSDNQLLIEGELVDLPNSPAGGKVSLWVSVSVDGRIELDATAGSKGSRVKIEAFMHGVLDDNEVQEQRQATTGLRLIR